MPMAAQVNNLDIVFLNAKLVRIVKEAQHCQSSNVSIVNEFDLARFNVFLTDLDAVVAWVQGQPHLDLPESAPTVFDLTDLEAVILGENDAINTFVQMIRTARMELVNAQSARMPAQLIDVDAVRFSAVVQKCRAFLADYVSKSPTLDLPESSPSEPVTAPGSLGTAQAANA
jgi:hypothetical protein